MKYLILFLIPLRAFAYEFGLEQGESNSYLANPEYYTSSKYSAVTFRKGPVEVIQGSWYGESSGRFFGLSGAFRTPGKTFFDGSFGVIHLVDYSGIQLDGHNQYTFTMGIGRKIDNLSVMVKFRHISNGNTQGKNRGLDFILLDIRLYIGH